MADLASRPTEIDSSLDKLRGVTASMAGVNDKNLSLAQRQTLRGLYGELEDYLVNKEPLLQLTPASLRIRLESKYGPLTFIDENLSDKQPPPAVS